VGVATTRRATIRNNIVYANQWNDYRVIAVGSAALGGGVQQDTAVYNNTIFVNPPNSTSINAVQGFNIVFNNLLYAPNSTGGVTLVAGTANGGDGANGNDIAGANPFIVDAPDQQDEFALKSSAPQINAGVTTLFVGQDFFGRPRDAQPDVGALEFNSQ
jgi:hypothetical protein